MQKNFLLLLLYALACESFSGAEHDNEILDQQSTDECKNLGCTCDSDPDPDLREFKETNSLLLQGGIVLTMDNDFKQIKEGYVAVKDGIIVGVGSMAELSTEHASIRPRVIVDAKDIIMPGFVNGHTHAPMSLLRGTADDKPLHEWLTGYIWPAEGALVDEEFVRVGTELAMLEMLSSGTTTFVDMYFYEDTIADAVEKAGMRGILGQSIIDLQDPESSFGHDYSTIEEVFEYARSFLVKWENHSLVTAAVAPHAPNTVSATNLKLAAALAAEFDAPLLIHLAETEAEVKEVAALPGGKATPTEYLDSLGFFDGGKVVAAHSVHMTAEDRAIFKEKHVHPVTCPQSNMKLASGTAAVVEMIEAGIHPGLATDGAASNNDLDMVTEMLVLSLLHKLVNMKADTMGARQVLKMATSWAAEGLGLGSRVGSLEVGKEADLTVVSTSSFASQPMYNPTSVLVYSASGRDVKLTAVQGRVLYKDGVFTTLDKDKILTEAHTYVARMCAVINQDDLPLFCKDRGR